MKKNEQIPLVHVKALIQMAKHGNTVKGGRRQKCKEGEKLYKMKKEICPLCDKISMYLMTHLQRVHKLEKKSSQYKKALSMTRRYRGKVAELLWDSELINKKRKAKGKLPAAAPVNQKVTTIYSSSSEEEDQASTSQSKKIKRSSVLQLLIQHELHSDSSDTSFDRGNISEESDIIPSTPVKTCSIMGEKLNAEPPSEKAEDQRSLTSRENKDSSSKQDHTNVKDGERHSEEDEPHREESSGEENDDEEWESEGSDFEMDLDKYKTLKKYYETTKGKTNQEQLLILFCDNPRNIFGGCKHKNQATLHAQHVHRILEELDPKDKDEHVESIARNGGIDVWKIWAKPLLDTKKSHPGTVKAYLTSLAKF